MWFLKVNVFQIRSRFLKNPQDFLADHGEQVRRSFGAKKESPPAVGRAFCVYI
jgi:hypothetical protein